ncbi:sensor histidine kinase [Streptomyces sp. NPDC048172]|uniref:sensor histidine kinase n=1 Tax=Streptomyces sp. NPDC048172 TaxID=3365505 RepID=UPI003721741F
MDRVGRASESSGEAERGALRAVREDLFPSAPQPVPPMNGPWPLRWLPHLAVAGLAALVAYSGTEDMSVRPLGVFHAALLVAGLLVPLPAWWLSLVMLPVFSLGQSLSPYGGWAWAVHTGLLFLVALRNPPRVLAGTVLMSTALLLGLQLYGAFPWRFILIMLALFAVTVAAATGVRATREVRARLAAQESALADERARRTVLEERARIARELHDVVAHHMSVISIQADAAPYRVVDPPEQLVTALADIRAGALEGLTELRRLLGVLRSENGPDGISLGPEAPQPTLDRLDDLLAGVRTAGLDVTAEVSGERRPLPGGVELSAYRITQEALSNVLRHAPGATARVELQYAPSALRLCVRNGPARQSAPPSPGAGHGVLGMRERAAALGGELSASPSPDGGYEVTALLPVPAAPAAARTDKERSA